jgi:hypothetical protein
MSTLRVAPLVAGRWDWVWLGTPAGWELAVGTR